MGELNLIRRDELRSVSVLDGFCVGNHVTSHGDVYFISDQPRPCVYTIQRIHPETNEILESREISLSTLKEYYKPFPISVQKAKELAYRILNGEEIESVDGSGSAELMAMNGKNALCSLREEANRSLIVAESVKRYAEVIIKQRTAELEAKLGAVRGVIAKMNKQIEDLDYAIQIVETYAGIKESVVQLNSGDAADEDTPVVFRQAVVFVDEELALIEDDFDYRKMGRFDEWLLADNNFKKLLPDEKSMIACKPRRTKKTYCDLEWLNSIMNQPNFETLFLIRNGDNLYRLESEHIVLVDRMFPNQDEYMRELEKEKNESFKEGYADLFQKRFTRVAFLLQGLMDRSNVFSPHSFNGSFIKMDGIDPSRVQLRYELDNSRALSDGRPSPLDWMKKLNEQLCEGKRVLLHGYEFCSDDFLKYYRSKYSAPSFPGNGLYTLYDNPNYRGESFGAYKHIIRYIPFSYWEKRVNREPIQLDIRGVGLLNYDDASLEDVEYYLNSRLHRSQYYSFVLIMKAYKTQYLRDKAAEDDYVRMMIGQIVAKGYVAREGYELDQIVREAINIVKGRLKWKRPITAKEKETYTLVERTLFSKSFVSKYLDSQK